jgi:hypothetical protein
LGNGYDVSGCLLKYKEEYMSQLPSFQNIKIAIIIVFFGLFVTNSITGFSQSQNSWPYRQSGYGNQMYISSYNDAPAWEGTIVTQSNDTVCGLIKFRYYSLPHHKPQWQEMIPLHITYYSKLITNNTKEIDSIYHKNRGSLVAILGQGNYSKDVIKIYTQNISCIIFNIKSPFINSDSTEYVNVDGNNLWRLIARRDKVSIYDVYDGIEKNPTKYFAKMVLATPNEIIKIYNSFPLIKNHLNSILRFINHRYNQHFKKKNFKTVHQMLDYILDKENERLKNEQK